MFDFCAISMNKALFSVDTEIYSDNIISKVCYWLNKEFSVSSKRKGKIIEICIESIAGEVDWPITQRKISQLFSDFHLREIIDAETKDIRTVLYVKAFANLDEFEEYEE